MTCPGYWVRPGSMLTAPDGRMETTVLVCLKDKLAFVFVGYWFLFMCRKTSCSPANIYVC